MILRQRYFKCAVTDTLKSIGSTSLVIAVTATIANANVEPLFNLGGLNGSPAVGWGINASRTVVGHSTTPSEAFRAFRYSGIPGSGGVMQPLGTLAGNTAGAWSLASDTAPAKFLDGQQLLGVRRTRSDTTEYPDLTE